MLYLTVFSITLVSWIIDWNINGGTINTEIIFHDSLFFLPWSAQSENPVKWPKPCKVPESWKNRFLLSYLKEEIEREDCCTCQMKPCVSSLYSRFFDISSIWRSLLHPLGSYRASKNIQKLGKSLQVFSSNKRYFALFNIHIAMLFLYFFYSRWLLSRSSCFSSYPRQFVYSMLYVPRSLSAMFHYYSITFSSINFSIRFISI